MRQFIIIAILLFVFLLGTSMVNAQNVDECAAENQAIIQTVSNVCAEIGVNEACYGNDNVNVTYIGTDDPNFNAPGARTNLLNISSLFLEAFNPENDIWGVAQLQLQVNQGNGTQNVTMLLFGDVRVENKAEPGEGLDTTVSSDNTQLFPVAPAQNFAALGAVNANTTVKALARLSNNTWVRIEIPESGTIGWVFRSRLNLTDEELNTLPVESGNAPHYGVMQAFSFQSGTSPNCETSVADGLLIQTPQGVARVSFLINEVTIELTSASETNGASAFVQADPTGGVMEVNVLDGTAYVGATNNPQQVEAGTQTSIPISVNLAPIGNPSPPIPFNQEEVRSIPALPLVRDPAQDFVPESNPQTSRTVAIETRDESLVVNNTGSTNTGSNGGTSGTGGTGGTGVDVVQNTDSGNGTTNTNSGSNNTNGDTNNTDNNPTAQANFTPSFPGGSQLGGGNNSGSTTNTRSEDDDTDYTVRNITLLVISIIAGLSFMAWLIYYTRRNQKV